MSIRQVDAVALNHFTPLHDNQSTPLQPKFHSNVIAKNTYSIDQRIYLSFIASVQLQIVHEQEMVDGLVLLTKLVFALCFSEYYRQWYEAYDKQQWGKAIPWNMPRRMLTFT